MMPTPISEARYKRTISKLGERVGCGYSRLRGLRENYYKMIEMYEGDLHPDRVGDVAKDFDDNQKDMPVNMFHRAVVTLEAVMTANDPIVEFRPESSADYSRIGVLFERYLTQLLREIKYRRTNARVLRDAIFGMGITRVGIEPTGEGLEWEGYWADPGRSFVSRVSPVDYFIDESARCQEEALYEGHRYRVLRHKLLELDGFDEEVLEKMPKWTERTTDGRVEYQQDEDGEWIDLVDVWVAPGYISREALIVTLPGYVQRGQSTPEIKTLAKNFGAIREPVEYDGPEGSPYNLLVFHEGTDKIIPTAPGSMWVRLSKMVGAMSSHIIDSDLRMKNMLIFDEKETQADVDAMLKAPNNYGVRMKNSSAAKQVTIGGSSDKAIQRLSYYMNLTSQEAGESNFRGGIGMSGGDKTATEVQVLAGRASMMENLYIERKEDHDTENFRRLAFYERQNPLLEAAIEMPNVPRELPSGMAPPKIMLTHDMVKDFERFERHFQIKAGSMLRKTREQIAREKIQAVPNVIMPAAQLQQLLPGFKAADFVVDVLDDLFSRAEVEKWFEDPELKASNAVYAAVQNGQEPPKNTMAGNGGNFQLKGVGLPGTDGQPNGVNTGANSPNFDIQGNTEAMGYGG